MTPCEELRSRGSDLLDGECDEQTATKLNTHLDECPECNPWYSSLQSTVALMQELPSRRPPDAVMEHIRNLTNGNK